MSAPSQVLWALDNHISPRDFERLCVDLLGREGYSRIVPIGGTNDLGRDAEAVYWRAGSHKRSVTVFQFSLQEDWEKKLRSDAVKIAAACSDATTLIFVTSRTTTGAKQSSLATAFKATYGWELTIYSREWLRMQLEEFHPDLALKYLGLDLPVTTHSVALQIDNFIAGDALAKELFNGKSPEAVKASIIEATRREPAVAGHWHRLAKIEIMLENFRGALEAITHALELDGADINFPMLRGVILAELGIEEQSMPLLVESKVIFADAVEKLHRAIDYYNLANVLVPLGELEAAEKNYLRCLEIEPRNAPAWKNLGSLYSKLGRHDQEMDCFNKALAIQPGLIEAHLSKANTLLVFFRKPGEAIKCFETAYRIQPELDRRWRHARYWFSRALAAAGHHERALQQVEISLRTRPDEVYLLNQKAAILRKLWPHDSKHRVKALEFFEFRARCIRHDYEGLAELIKIHAAKGSDVAAWPFIEGNLNCAPYKLETLIGSAGLTIRELQIGLTAGRLFRRFRETKNVTDHGFRLHDHGLSPNPTMIPALNFSTIASFGVAHGRFLEASKHPESPISADVFDQLLDQLSLIYAQFGVDWLAESKPVKREEQTALLSLGVLHISEVVLAEASRVIGCLGGHFDVPVENWFDRISNWNEVRSEAGVRLLDRVLEQWKMLRPPPTLDP